MDNRYLRLQLDAEILARSEAVCAREGQDLLDVLRAVVTRIAQTDAIPPGLTLASPAGAVVAHDAPFSHYQADLWSSVRPLVDADLAVALLDRFIAQIALQLREARAARSPDHERIERLERERREALEVRAQLNLDDLTAVPQILSTYASRIA